MDQPTTRRIPVTAGTPEARRAEKIVGLTLLGGLLTLFAAAVAVGFHPTFPVFTVAAVLTALALAAALTAGYLITHPRRQVHRG